MGSRCGDTFAADAESYRKIVSTMRTDFAPAGRFAIDMTERRLLSIKAAN
jgi:hypothetical protein